MNIKLFQLLCQEKPILNLDLSYSYGYYIVLQLLSVRNLLKQTLQNTLQEYFSTTVPRSLPIEMLFFFFFKEVLYKMLILQEVEMCVSAIRNSAGISLPHQARKTMLKCNVGQVRKQVLAQNVVCWGWGSQMGSSVPLGNQGPFQYQEGKRKLVEEEKDIGRKRELFTSQYCLKSILLIKRVAEMA